MYNHGTYKVRVAESGKISCDQLLDRRALYEKGLIFFLILESRVMVSGRALLRMPSFVSRDISGRDSKHGVSIANGRKRSSSVWFSIA